MSAPAMITAIRLASDVFVVYMAISEPISMKKDCTNMKSPILTNILTVSTSEFSLTRSSPVRHLSKLEKENEAI